LEEHQLLIKYVHDIPLTEVSGLGQRRTAKGSNEILAVGDRQFDIVIIRVEGDELKHQTISLASLLEGVSAGKSSEWEAADGDGTGRVFMLQESPSRVYVASPNLSQIERVIDLNLDAHQRRELTWDADSNARAEGLVLLANGHVLVAKEKEPPLILEFGNSNEGGRGVRPDLLLDSSEEYPLPDEHDTSFELLTTWHLDESAGITDISDMATGPDDRLYVLSDESRCIARLETAASRGKSEIHVHAAWHLPQEIEQPEGLVIMKDMVPVVAIDRDEQYQNLFVMEPLA
jgi:uncharacterized protein YjiK